MKFKPIHAGLLLMVTFVLSAVGVACMAAGTHGPRAMSYVGEFLLLPSFLLAYFGAPLAIPLLYRVGIVSTTAFFLVQLAYYYGLFHLFSLITKKHTTGRKLR
jgi:hypothetical protein